MQLSTFVAKAEIMGDFVLYYRKKENSNAMAVCTADLDNEYIQARLGRFKNRTLKEGEVLLWNWQFNSPLLVSVDKIKRMTPLGAVLKNNR